MVAILGERNKWVPVSPQRIANVEIRNNDLIIDLNGASNEVSFQIEYILMLVGTPSHCPEQ